MSAIFYECSCILNLLDQEKKSNVRLCQAFYHNKFNKFNYTGAQMLDSIYHMTPNLL